MQQVSNGWLTIHWVHIPAGECWQLCEAQHLAVSSAALRWRAPVRQAHLRCLIQQSRQPWQGKLQTQQHLFGAASRLLLCWGRPRPLLSLAESLLLAQMSLNQVRGALATVTQYGRHSLAMC